MNIAALYASPHARDQPMAGDTFPELLVELRQALAAMNLPLALETSARMQRALRLAPQDVVVDDLSRALKAFRNKRLFEPLRRTAEAYFQYDQPALCRYQYAQALVDEDSITAALCMVETLSQQSLSDEVAEEVRGLRGRAYKQAFVRSADDAERDNLPLPQHAREALRLAIQAYERAYDEARLDPNWPKANLIALLTRARLEDVAVASKYDRIVLARELVASVARALPDPDADCAQPWLLASALEATLALGDSDLTLHWGKRYLNCESADAFEFGSTLRQFTEIWQLHKLPMRDGGPAQRLGELLALLEAAVLRRRGGQVESARGTRALVDSQLRVPQAVWGEERFQDYAFIRGAVQCADAVARVEDHLERPKGTGFAIRGGELYAPWGDELVLVTNRHVVDKPPGARGVAPEYARAQFTTLASDAHAVALKWRSSPDDPRLDVAVLALNSAPTGVRRLLTGDVGNLQPNLEPPARVYVIGHPQGSGKLAFSMYDNEFLGHEAPYLRYRSPTLDGSSGSPLFDGSWNLVGIHHSAEPALDASQGANVGSSINAIRKAIAQDPSLR
ncbi:MAG TPA: serine protease [Polyangiales bacterium]